MVNDQGRSFVGGKLTFPGLHFFVDLSLKFLFIFPEGISVFRINPGQSFTDVACDDLRIGRVQPIMRISVGVNIALRKEEGESVATPNFF